MALSNLHLALTTAYGVISLFLYIIVTTCIIKYRKSFNNTFYTLFLVLSFNNCISYLIAYTTLHMPEYLLQNDTITLFYEANLSGHVGGFIFFYSMHSEFMTLLMNFVINFNRFSCIAFPFTYEKMWRYLTPIAIAFVYIAPFIFTYPLLSIKTNFVWMDGYLNFLSEANIDGIFIQEICTMGTIAIVVIAQSVYMIYSLNQKKLMKSSKNERSLFILSFVNCSILVLIFVFTAILAYLQIACEEGCNDTVNELNIVLNLIIPYECDLVVLIDPYLMLIINRSLRQKVKELLHIPTIEIRSYKKETSSMRIKVSGKDSTRSTLSVMTK